MSTPAAAVPEQPPLSEASRILDTFIAPSKTFTDIRRNASWWAPWLLIAIMSLAFIYLVDHKVGFDQVMRNEMAKSPSRSAQFEKMPPDQRALAMQRGAAFTKYISYAAPVNFLIILVIVAAVLMATFNFGAGAEIGFKQSMAVVAYSWLPSIISGALAMVSLLVGVDTEGFNIRNPVATNPAYFMDPTQHQFLYGAASAVDVFGLWMVVLMGIGYSSVSKLKRMTAIIIVLVWYLVIKLGGAALSAM